VKLALQGHQVTMYHVASGVKGQMIIPPRALKEIGGQVGKTAGLEIGAEVVSLGRIIWKKAKRFLMRAFLQVFRTR
jgi:hypothetical protein